MDFRTSPDEVSNLEVKFRAFPLEVSDLQMNFRTSQDGVSDLDMILVTSMALSALLSQLSRRWFPWGTRGGAALLLMCLGPSGHQC